MARDLYRSSAGSIDRPRRRWLACAYAAKMSRKVPVIQSLSYCSDCLCLKTSNGLKTEHKINLIVMTWNVSIIDNVRTNDWRFTAEDVGLLTREWRRTDLGRYDRPFNLVATHIHGLESWKMYASILHQKICALCPNVLPIVSFSISLHVITTCVQFVVPQSKAHSFINTYYVNPQFFYANFLLWCS